MKSTTIAIIILAVLGKTGTARSPLTIVADGVPQCTVVVSAAASPSETWASRELVSHIEQMSGAKLELQVEPATLPQSAIFVGDGQGVRSLGITIDQVDLGAEGFLLKSTGNHLVIAGGRQRGTMYGVFALLEQIGNRWWLVTPAGHGIFIRAVSKVDVSDCGGSGALLAYDGVFLQTATDDISPNLSAAAENPLAQDVVHPATKVSLQNKGDALYLGSSRFKPNFTYFWLGQLEAGGKLRWEYSTTDGWKPIQDGGKASYVILRGLTLRSPRIHGIVLGKNAHDVVIERCDISGWGRVDKDGRGVDYDYDLLSGKLVSAGKQERHGLVGVPVYATSPSRAEDTARLGEPCYSGCGRKCA